MKKLFLALGLILSTITYSSEKPQRISFTTMWLPQSQFAGYYMAKEKGFYEELNLDVEIIDATPDKLAPQLLEEGLADMGVMWLSEALQINQQSVKFVNVGQIVQKSGTMLVGKKSSGINSISDINNKKVGLWPGSIGLQPKTFIKQYHLQVDFIPQTYSINAFLRDTVDLTCAMWYNEYYMILNSGYNPDELTSFFFSDHNLNFPEDGIYVNADFLKAHPNDVNKFVLASLKGWLYAFNHSEETLQVILNRMRAARIPANESQQRWMLNRMYDIIIENENNSFGILKKSDFNKVQSIMFNDKLIEKKLDFNKIYHPCFSYDIKK